MGIEERWGKSSPKDIFYSEDTRLWTRISKITRSIIWTRSIERRRSDLILESAAPSHSLATVANDSLELLH